MAENLAKKEEVHWTEAEFENMHPKVLRMFAQFNGKATMKEPWLTMTRERGYSKADMAIARKVWLRQGAKNIAHERPEDFVKTHGGLNISYPDKVEMTSLSGEVRSRPNSPIPAPYGYTEKYSNIVAVAAFCSQLVKNDGGKWLQTPNDQWVKVFGQTFLAMETIDQVADVVIKILEADIVWKSYTQTDRNSVSGISAMTFVRMAIERLDIASYEVLNTKIVCDGFRTFSRQQDEWMQNMEDEDTPLVPETMYQVVSNPSVVAQKLLMKDYPSCFLYLGGDLPSPILPQALGTLEAAKKSGQKLREVLGKDVSTANVLSGMRDFSGLTDFFGKKMAFFLSSALACWRKGKNVDIQLESIGDAFTLASSLNHWRSYINAMPTSTAMTSSLIFPFIGGEAYCFLVPSVDTVVPEKLKSLIVDVPRVDAVFIMWSTSVLPTSDEKGAKVDYDALSVELIPVKARRGDFILHSVIYGMAPFPNDKAVETRKKNRIREFEKWEKGSFVYKFSTSAHFRGIVSSLSGLKLVGFGFLKTEHGWDKRQGNCLVEVSLSCIEKQSQWYKEVSLDCNRQIVSFLCPVIRYSPISNLCRMSKNALIAATSVVQREDGEMYVATPTPVKRVIARKAPVWGEKVEKKVAKRMATNEENLEALVAVPENMPETELEQGEFADEANDSDEGVDDSLEESEEKPLAKPKKWQKKESSSSGEKIAAKDL